MIDMLTPEQEEQLDNYIEKWQKIALSTRLTNRHEVEKCIQLAYQVIGLKPPRTIRWFESPFEILHSIHESLQYAHDEFEIQVGTSCISKILQVDQLAVTSVHNVVESLIVDNRRILRRYFESMPSIFARNLEQVVRAMIASEIITVDMAVIRQTLTYFLNRQFVNAHFDFARNILGFTKETDHMTILWYIDQNTSFWIPYKNVCFVSERPTILNLDEQSRLHSASQFAFGYPDGWGIYAWHGVQVPEFVIMRPQDITPDKIVQENNSEVARVMLERYGQDNFLRDGGFSMVQSDDYGELYCVKLKNTFEPIVAVRVKDASTDREYFLYVPPHIRTAHEGVAWSFGYDNPSDYAPDKET